MSVLLPISTPPPPIDNTGKPTSGGPIRTFPDSFPDASFLSAFGTTPKAQWASVNEYLVPDTGTSSTNAIIATRVTARLAGGRWKRLAVVYLGAQLDLQYSPMGTGLTMAKAAFRCALELRNGTETPNSYLSPNTGGTIIPVTFNGVRDAELNGGEVLVSDWITAASVGLTAFEVTDRTKDLMVRTAWTKTNATDILGCATQTGYNYPSNSHLAVCSSTAVANALIDAPGISNYGAADKWNSSDTATLPSHFGLIGEAMDGQISLLFTGTSILDGDGDGSGRPGGTDPAGQMSPENYELLGWPSRWAQRKTVSVPCLNFAVGASKILNVWGPRAETSTRPIAEINLQRQLLAHIAGWFDVVTVQDPNNDSLTNFPGNVRRFCEAVRRANPKARIYGVRVPSGGPAANGAITVYPTGNLDPKYAVLDQAVTDGVIDAVINLQTGDKTFPVLASPVTATATGGTTTTIVDSTKAWVLNQWINSYVVVDGERRTIVQNNGGDLTVDSAFSAATSGKTYEIVGNTSSDLLHPSAHGHRYLADKWDEQFALKETFPRFVRTR